MWGNNMVRDEGLFEEITSFIIHDLELGIVSRNCECVKEFLDAFVSTCAFFGWEDFC